MHVAAAVTLAVVVFRFAGCAALAQPSSVLLFCNLFSALSPALLAALLLSPPACKHALSLLY